MNGDLAPRVMTVLGPVSSTDLYATTHFNSDPAVLVRQAHLVPCRGCGGEGKVQGREAPPTGGTSSSRGSLHLLHAEQGWHVVAVNLH